MNPERRSLLQLLACAPLASCSGSGPAPQTPSGSDAISKIKPLFKPKRPPVPGDWLETHKEPGQTYQQFRAITPTPAASRYSTLRIVPIGTLSDGQQEVVNVVIDFLQPFFGLELAISPAVPIDAIPEDSTRRQSLDGPPQLLTTYLLNSVLLPLRQPADAAVLAITAADLWPGPGWNFVFGQASLKERVGVWSMARNGDADGRADMRKLCALRTTMTATHETGHMFGIRHCIAYECGMNGSNHSEERDRQPLEFCPECQPKLWWTCALDPLERSRALAAVARRHGFPKLAGAFDRQSQALA
ncbi:MAG TPA: archaemetzincin [Steroidobacteraceae bacterium]|nr:archaemetzincin [Steroidobacteraceae bacterium]